MLLFNLLVWHFYPFSIAHNSVLEQAEQIFDKVIIAQGNVANKTSFVWEDDKYGKLNNFYKKNYEFVDITGLTTDIIKDIEKYANVTLVRGLRNSYDLMYEQNYIQSLKDIYPQVKAVLFLTKPEYAHISSTLIRDILKLSPKDAYKYYRNE